MNRSVNRLFPVLILIVAVCAGRTSAASNFSDITSWAGSGSNSAALVIDWSDGSTPLVWGYHWNGTATGVDMLEAIVTADPHLYAMVDSTYTYGYCLLGLGYHQSGDGNFQLSPPLTVAFSADHIADTLSSADSDADADTLRTVAAGDRWQAGWNDGGWVYWNSTTASASFSGWTMSEVGMSDRTLVNGAWDGYSFDAGYAGYPGAAPGTPVAAATPEPASLGLLGLGALLILRRRSRRA